MSSARFAKRRDGRHVKGKLAAAPGGRPRALSARQAEVISALYLVLTDHFMQAKFRRKFGARINHKWVISTLARGAHVSERVIRDVIRRCGAYKAMPITAPMMREIHQKMWLEGLRERLQIKE